MKNNRLSNITALAMGLLVIFSGQALSFSLHQQKFNHGTVLDNSQFLIAQENISVSVAVGVATKVLNRAISVVETVTRTRPVDIPAEYRELVLPKLQQAKQAMAKAETSARKGDNSQVASAVAQAISFMGEAAASAQADAGSVKVISQAITKANEALALSQAQTK
jgi:5'-3' exonuclease